MPGLAASGIRERLDSPTNPLLMVSEMLAMAEGQRSRWEEARKQAPQEHPQGQLVPDVLACRPERSWTVRMGDDAGALLARAVVACAVAPKIP